MTKHSEHSKNARLQEILLWDDHFYLTREVVKDAVYNIPCLQQDLAALNQNQVDLGKNFSDLTHSKTAGKKLTDALLKHIDIAVKIVVAAIAGNTTLVAQLYKEWVVNAKEIAAIYNKYNCHIRYNKIEKLMIEHLDTTLAEASAIISKNCQLSVQTGKIALEHVREMAKYIKSKF